MKNVSVDVQWKHFHSIQTKLIKHDFSTSYKLTGAHMKNEDVGMSEERPNESGRDSPNDEELFFCKEREI